MSHDEEIALETRNADAISAGHARWLAPPAEGKVCAVCSGTGVVPNTETEHLFGEPCPEGCKLDIQRIRDQGQG